MWVLIIREKGVIKGWSSQSETCQNGTWRKLIEIERTKHMTDGLKKYKRKKEVI